MLFLALLIFIRCALCAECQVNMCVARRDIIKNGPYGIALLFVISTDAQEFPTTCCWNLYTHFSNVTHIFTKNIWFVFNVIDTDWLHHSKYILSGFVDGKLAVTALFYVVLWWHIFGLSLHKVSSQNTILISNQQSCLWIISKCGLSQLFMVSNCVFGL